MQYGQIEGIGQPVSRLIIGSMVCTSDDVDSTCTLMDAWVGVGGNAVDTAHIYGGGKSERALGEWMRRRGNRERIVVVGKGAHHNSSGARVYPDAIAEDLADSLERLQTPYIDLYLLHRDDPSVPVGPIVECLDGHVKAGRLRAYGGSNWTAARIEEANAYAAEHGLRPFVASSPHLSLAIATGPMWAGCLNVDAAERAWYIEKQLPMLPWSSQAGGFFTGRYTPDTHTNSDVERIYYSEENWARLRRAQEVGAHKGVSANNIALAYVLHQPFPVFPLFGPRTVEELASSLPALDVDLSAEDIRTLEVGP